MERERGIIWSFENFIYVLASPSGIYRTDKISFSIFRCKNLCGANIDAF